MTGRLCGKAAVLHRLLASRLLTWNRTGRAYLPPNQYVMLNRMMRGPSTPVGDRNVAMRVCATFGSPSDADERQRRCRSCTLYVVFAFVRL